MKNLHAYTEVTPNGGYPGYVNLVEDGTLSLRPTGQASSVSLKVPEAELLKLADAIYAQFSAAKRTATSVQAVAAARDAMPRLPLAQGANFQL